MNFWHKIALVSYLIRNIFKNLGKIVKRKDRLNRKRNKWEHKKMRNERTMNI